MVKFSNGMWWAADGVNIDWATESVKSEAKAQSIRCVAVRDPWYLVFTIRRHDSPAQSSKHINHRGDTLNTPTITLECSSPLPDILLLTGYHWKAQQSTILGPDYELYPDVDYKQLVCRRWSYD